MTDFEDFLARLNPKTAASFRKASTIELEHLSTPSLGVNMAIGGLGYGRFSTLYGNRLAGKTMFALQCVANAQKDGKICAWLDVEKNFNPSFARNLGADPDQMAVATNIISMADMANQSVDLILKGADVLVIDSISQLLPQSYFEDAKNGTGELKELEKTGQIGTFSKNLGQAINMMNSVNEHCAIILISQVRNQFSSYGASLGYMGGKALEHANSTVLKFWRSKSDVIEGKVHVGDLILTRPIGSKVVWTVEKNRGPGNNWSNEYDIYDGGDHIGIDLTGEIVTFGVEYGVVNKSGNWLDFEGIRTNGRAAFIKELRDNPEVQEKIYLEVLERSAA
jgi:recombination protein RecA